MSYALAVRLPLPLIISASAFPDAQFARLTTSCTIADTSGVCCFTFTVGHDGTFAHTTCALVFARLEMFPVAELNVSALSAACPAIVSVVVGVLVSSTSNST